MWPEKFIPCFQQKLLIASRLHPFLKAPKTTEYKVLMLNYTASKTINHQIFIYLNLDKGFIWTLIKQWVSYSPALRVGFLMSLTWSLIPQREHRGSWWWKWSLRYQECTSDTWWGHVGTCYLTMRLLCFYMFTVEVEELETLLVH